MGVTNTVCEREAFLTPDLRRHGCSLMVKDGLRADSSIPIAEWIMASFVAPARKQRGLVEERLE